MDIWKVTITYETPGDYVSNKSNIVYTLVDDNKENAKNRACEDFSKREIFSDLDLSLEKLVVDVKRIKNQRIVFPELSLNDRKGYKISARLSENGDYVEFFAEKSK